MLSGREIAVQKRETYQEAGTEHHFEAHLHRDQLEYPGKEARVQSTGNLDGAGGVRKPEMPL